MHSVVDERLIYWHNAKCSFYRAFDAIFGRLGRSAQVVLHLVRSKCIPVLLYGLGACPINATDFKSLQHPINNIFMKMFATKSAEGHRISTSVWVSANSQSNSLSENQILKQICH